MDSTPKKWIRRIAPLLWCGVIFLLSAQPDPPGTGLLDIIPFADKIGHACIYAILAALTYEALRREDSPALRARAALLAVVWAMIYGATDEYHQSFVPGRVVDFFDWTADVTGAVAGLVLWGLWRRRKSPRARTGAE